MSEQTKIKLLVMAQFNCPGCKQPHTVSVGGYHSNWNFNNNLATPTLEPSVLVRGTKDITDEEHSRIMAGEKITPVPTVCHSFVRNGQIEFLADCTHELAGQTVPLPAIA